ncbi:MAG: hypothetical protein ACYTGZ_21295 [Planctomycetota bacterium]
MTRLDPELLFEQLAEALPDDVHDHVFVVGSLAAAYHFRVKLDQQGVNTKDADLVVHPAGNTGSCVAMAERLFEREWRRHPDCWASKSPEPSDALRAIRLYPPDSMDYFVEFLNLPEPDQVDTKIWIPIELHDGWYGLPTFRFQGLSACDRLVSNQGLEYASPAMMALPNLLSHPTVRPERMSMAIGGREILRSAKDLGRVLALAHLASRDEVEAWLDAWHDGITTCFPDDWRALAQGAGTGLRELLTQNAFVDEALHTCEVGILRGRGVTLDNLRATGDRILIDLIEPFEAAAREDE